MKTRLSDHIRQSVLLYSAAAGLVLAVAVAFATMIPFYRTLRRQREDKLTSLLLSRAAAVEVFLGEKREIARLLASRTSIRDNFFRHQDGQAEETESLAPSERSLEISVTAARGLVAAYCQAPDGEFLAHVGEPPPTAQRTREWWRAGIAGEEEMLPVRTEDGYRLVCRVPVRAPDGEKAGALVLLFAFERLQERFERLPDAGEGEDTFLGALHGEEVRIFLELRGRRRVRRRARHDPQVTEALRLAADGRTGLLSPNGTLDEPELLAYAPVADTDWGIAIRQSQQALLADIDRQLFRVAGIVLGLIFVFGLGMILLLRPLAGKLVLHSRELEDQVDAQTAKLDAERKRLLAVTQDLERQKSQLESANEDLEAFTRTVAHDLRTPLVTIQGFADLLLDSERGTQNEDHRQMLSRIVAKSRLMAEQIKALLGYARAGKAEINRTTVDLSHIAEEIAADLRHKHPERDVDFSVQPDLKASADEPLVYTVMENLLGNAWKYTSRTDDARIEVGAEDRNGEEVYYVRDNGTGFDMMFAERLFQPFQRLHSDSEFSGTGIGLSTVRRIIEQHGGRIRAEGKLERGATFYFTLPETAA